MLLEHFRNYRRFLLILPLAVEPIQTPPVKPRVCKSCQFASGKGSKSFLQHFFVVFEETAPFVPAGLITLNHLLNIKVVRRACCCSGEAE
jgi:hypothetical protein